MAGDTDITRHLTPPTAPAILQEAPGGFGGVPAVQVWERAAVFILSRYVNTGLHSRSP